MSAEIIKVLDYLCDKFGIAIDWTAENVWPQVLDFIGRYQAYAITKHCVGMIFCVVAIIASIFIIKKVIKYDLDGFEIFVSVVLGVVSLVCIGVAISQIFSAIEWGIVPEIKFTEMLSGYLD